MNGEMLTGPWAMVRRALQGKKLHLSIWGEASDRERVTAHGDLDSGESGRITRAGSVERIGRWRRNPWPPTT